MDTSILLQYASSTRYTAFDQFKNSNPTQVSPKDTNKTLENLISFKASIQYRTRTESNNQVINFDIAYDQRQQTEFPASLTNPSTANSALSLFDDSYWGANQTADRLANFVILGGGDNIDKIRSGREGIIRGFKEAEELWGETLPDVSYQTLEKALEKIDNRIRSFGEPVINVAA